MPDTNSRWMTTQMLVNAALQAERHAFDRTVDLNWLRQRALHNGFHLATVVIPNNRPGRIVLPHHRVEILMQQHGVDGKLFDLDISLDAWEMLIPISDLHRVNKQLSSPDALTYWIAGSKVEIALPRIASALSTSR